MKRTYPTIRRSTLYPYGIVLMGLLGTLLISTNSYAQMVASAGGRMGGSVSASSATSVSTTTPSSTPEISSVSSPSPTIEEPPVITDQTNSVSTVPEVLHSQSFVSTMNSAAALAQAVSIDQSIQEKLEKSFKMNAHRLTRYNGLKEVAQKMKESGKVVAKVGQGDTSSAKMIVVEIDQNITLAVNESAVLGSLTFDNNSQNELIQHLGTIKDQEFVLIEISDLTTLARQTINFGDVEIGNAVKVDGGVIKIVSAKRFDAGSDPPQVEIALEKDKSDEIALPPDSSSSDNRSSSDGAEYLFAALEEEARNSEDGGAQPGQGYAVEGEEETSNGDEMGPGDGNNGGNIPPFQRTDPPPAPIEASGNSNPPDDPSQFDGGSDLHNNSPPVQLVFDDKDITHFVQNVWQQLKLDYFNIILSEAKSKDSPRPLDSFTSASKHKIQELLNSLGGSRTYLPEKSHLPELKPIFTVTIETNQIQNPILRLSDKVPKLS